MWFREAWFLFSIFAASVLLSAATIAMVEGTVERLITFYFEAKKKYLEELAATDPECQQKFH